MNLYTFKIISISVILVVLFLFQTLIIYIYAKLRKRPKIKKQLVVSNLVLGFIFQPLMISMYFNSLSCFSIANRYFLD